MYANWFSCNGNFYELIHANLQLAYRCPSLTSGNVVALFMKTRLAPWSSGRVCNTSAWFRALLPSKKTFVFAGEGTNPQWGLVINTDSNRHFRTSLLGYTC